MSDPARFSDDDGDEHERRLLRSAAGDRGSDCALRATLGAMGAAAGVALGAASASAGVAAAASTGGSAAGSAGGGLTATGSAGLAAWVGLGALVGAITVGGVAAIEGVSRPVASAALSAVEERPVPVTGDAPTSAPQARNERPAPTPPRASAGARTAVASLAADVPPIAPAYRADFPPAPPNVPPNAPPNATDSLAAEVGALQRVRVALAAGDAPGALAALDAHARDFARPALGPEAAVLRVEALARAGRRAEASALADRLLAASPSSPLATRLRTVLGRGSNP